MYTHTCIHVYMFILLLQVLLYMYIYISHIASSARQMDSMTHTHVHVSGKYTYMAEHSSRAQYRGFKSHLRQLIFLLKGGVVVLCCIVLLDVCYMYLICSSRIYIMYNVHIYY